MLGFDVFSIQLVSRGALLKLFVGKHRMGHKLTIIKAHTTAIDKESSLNLSSLVKEILRNYFRFRSKILSRWFSDCGSNISASDI